MREEKVKMNDAEQVDEDDEFEDTQKDKYLTFSLEDEEYGIEIRHIIEIVGIQHVASVPDMPPYIKGVINLRGQVIPVMDVRLRFHMPPREYDERTCVVIARVDESSVGLVVDTVREVIDLPSENVSEPPRVARAESARFIKGIGRVEKGVKILIDVEKFLFEEDSKPMEAVGASA